MNNLYSLINEYPIDYNSFPLAKKCKEYKIELSKNEYLVIPKYWCYWIFTEPNTLSINYQINNIEFIETTNDFYNSFKNSLPFVKLINRVNISHDYFIKNSRYFHYKCLFSENYKCSPINNKFYYETMLRNIIYINDNKNYYSYIANNKIDKNNILSQYNNINYLISKSFYKNINYNTSVFFTLDKKIDSGLRYDLTDNIIYVLDGKITIHLYNPNCRDNLYFQ